MKGVRPTVVHDLTRNRGQSGEFIGCSLRVLARQPTHQRTLAHGREPDEANTGHTSPGHVEACTAATSASTRSQELALQLGQLGLELAQMERSRLVLLGLGHLFWESLGSSGTKRPSLFHFHFPLLPPLNIATRIPGCVFGVGWERMALSGSPNIPRPQYP